MNQRVSKSPIKLGYCPSATDRIAPLMPPLRIEGSTLAVPAPDDSGYGANAPDIERAQILTGAFGGKQTAAPAYPENIGRYRIDGILGNGSMGTVYLGLSRDLNRRVAIKTLGRLVNERLIRRFELEARAIAVLSHPNVVKVFQFGEDNGVQYIAMEYIDGVTLDELMRLGPSSGSSAGDGNQAISGFVHRAQRRKTRMIECAKIGSESAAPEPVTSASVKPDGSHSPLRFIQAAHIMVQIADALAHAHQRGVIHRDLKPANVMIASDDGRPIVTDFGLALVARDNAVECSRRINPERLTAHGELLGTPAYMSPEQARGQTDRIDERTDIYAMGAILYEMLAGAPLIPKNIDAYKALTYVVSREPARLRALNSRIPADLETICRKCLNKDPDARYQSSDALSDDLKRFIEGRPILARPASVSYRLTKHVQRHRLIYTVLGAALILIAGLAWYAKRELTRGQMERKDAELAQIRLENEALRAKQTAERNREQTLKFKQKIQRSRTIVWENALDRAYSDGELPLESNADLPYYLPAETDGDFDWTIDVKFQDPSARLQPIIELTSDSSASDASPQYGSELTISLSESDIGLKVNSALIERGRVEATIVSPTGCMLVVQRAGRQLSVRGGFYCGDSNEAFGSQPPLLLEYQHLTDDSPGGNRLGVHILNASASVRRISLLKPLLAALNRPLAFAEKLYRKNEFSLAVEEYSEALLLIRDELQTASDEQDRRQAAYQALRALFGKARSLEKTAFNSTPADYEPAILGYKEALAMPIDDYEDSTPAMTELRARALGRLRLCLLADGKTEQADNVLHNLLDPTIIHQPDEGIAELIERHLSDAIRLRATDLNSAITELLDAARLTAYCSSATRLDRNLYLIARILLDFSTTPELPVDQQTMKSLCETMSQAGSSDPRVRDYLSEAVRAFGACEPAE